MEVSERRVSPEALQPAGAQASGLKQVASNTKAPLMHAFSGIKSAVGTGLKESSGGASLSFRVISHHLRSTLQSSLARFSTKLETTFAHKEHPLKQAADDTGLSLKAFKKEIRTVCEQAAVNLGANQSIEVDISDQHHVFVVSKDKDDRIGIVYKQKLLGSGTFADVYRTYSLDSKKERAVKYSKDDENAQTVKDNEADIQNESRVTTHLNRGKKKPPEGLPGTTKVTQFVNNSDSPVNERAVAETKLYKKGSLQSQVDIRRLALVLGVSAKKMRGMGENELRKAINHELQFLNDPKLSDKKAYDAAINKFTFPLATTLGFTIGQEIDGRAQSAWTMRKQSKDPFKEVRDALSSALLEAAQKLQKRPYSSQSEMCRMGANLVAGLITMHENGVIHGDLKPANFLASTRGAILADFGGSQIVTSDPHKTPLSTPGYAASSLLDAVDHYKSDDKNFALAGKALDQRELGISLYEMFTGSFISEKDLPESTYRLMQGVMITAGIPKRAAEIIAKMANAKLFDKTNPPATFPLQVSQEELQELYYLLKTA